jgi:hypothetical protein
MKLRRNGMTVEANPLGFLPEQVFFGIFEDSSLFISPVGLLHLHQVACYFGK